MMAAIALLTIPIHSAISGGPARSATATCNGYQATIVGARSSDTLIGTPRRDVIAAGAGNDGINGKGGNDVICGGRGNDMIVGGAGADRLFGGAGSDYVLGGGVKDRLSGGSGKGDLCLAGRKGRSDVTCEARSTRPGCPPAFAAEYGVRDPERFTMYDPCRTVTGKVLRAPRAELDGDRTYDITDDATKVTYHVEEVPRDQRHLPLPAPGDRLTVTGANVRDNHDLNELHPVYVLRQADGRTHYSGPQYGGIPPSSSPADCWTPTGAVCPSW
jgi:hypothetical protein